jgi:fibronectin type 3 domain-containing protein
MLNTRYQASDGECQTRRQSPARPNVLFLFAFCSLLSVSGSLLAAPQYFVIPDTSRVYVVLAAAPAEMSGFTVQRQSARGTFENLTPAPVAPMLDPEQAQATLGTDEYAWVTQVLKTDDPIAVLARLKHDRGVGQALSLVSLKVAEVLGRIFVDTSARTGSTYTYRITFLKNDGSELARYDERVTVAAHAGPELKATNLAAEADNAEVKLRWRYPRYAGDRADIVIGFNIYRRPSTSGQTPNPGFEKLTARPLLRSSDTLSFPDHAVENDQTYEYCITAVDNVGAESPRSTPVSATPHDTLGPPPPYNVKAMALQGKVLISWQVPLDTQPLAGYNVYRSWSLHGEFSKLNPTLLPAGQNSWLDTNVVSESTYVYRVRTKAKSGKEGRPSAAGFASPSDTVPPGPPTGVTAVADKHIVRLTWKSRPTPDLAGYYVYRAEGNDKLFRLRSTPLGPDTTEFTDSGFGRTGLYPGKHYRYAVSQVDFAHNESKRDSTTLLITDDMPPLPPATAYGRSSDDGRVLLTWQMSMSSDAAGYRVYRDTGSLFAHPVRLADLPRSAREYRDSSATKGRRYWYEVAAVDSAGNQGSSPAMAVTPADIAPPPAPTGFKATLSKTAVELSWQSVTESDLAGYNVYRADAPSGVPEKLNREPLNEMKYTDPAGGATHYYWVRALDTSGNESPRSEVVRPTP